MEMLIWKRERVAFLHCAMRVTQCTKGGVEFARRPASDNAHEAFFHRIWRRRPSHILDMQISLQKVIRAHSLNKCHFIWRVNEKKMH
jgi:hypothetical protein